MSPVLSARALEVADLALSVCPYPIGVHDDHTLQVWSSTRYPRHDEQVCIVRYHPAREKFLDYLVAHECAHIYRFYSAPPEQRLVPAANAKGLYRAAKSMEPHCAGLRRQVPRETFEAFLIMLCSELVLQLTNAPADCRIERWLHDEFDSLRDIQAEALQELHAQALRCLEPRIKRCAPKPIYEKSNAMNYVLAKTTAEMFREPNLLQPYIESGFDKVGEKLDSHLLEADEGYRGDKSAVDAWAKELDMTGWYRWLALK